jgi:hypothetical protein
VASPDAAPPSQSSGDGARVIVEGGFSNIRYTEEHAYGQEVKLRRQGSRLLGLFMYTEGPQADFPTGLLEHVRFNSATGELSFDAYASQFHFDGRLEKATIKGVLKQMHPIDGLLAEIDYDRRVVRLQPDDLMVMYSDGVSEARNPAGEELCRDGLIAMAGRLDSSSVEAFGTGLTAELDAFRWGRPAIG